MTTQTDGTAWSGAVQRELDALQRSVDSRFVDFGTRLDKLLTLTEYHADIRGTDIRNQNIADKLRESEQDLESFKRDVRQSFDTLHADILAERARWEAALNRETEERKSQYREFIQARKDQFRWFVSLVMIPIGIAIVDLIMKKG